MVESGDGSERFSPRLSGENLMRGSGGRLRLERRENFNTERRGELSEVVGGEKEVVAGGGLGEGEGGCPCITQQNSGARHKAQSEVASRHLA